MLVKREFKYSCEWGSRVPTLLWTWYDCHIISWCSEQLVPKNILLLYCIWVKHPFHWHWTLEMNTVGGHKEPSGCHPPPLYNGHTCRGWKTDGWWASGGQPMTFRMPCHHCGSRWGLNRAAAEGSVGLCGSGCLSGVKVYTITSQKAPTSASISRQVEGKGSPFV